MSRAGCGGESARSLGVGAEAEGSSSEREECVARIPTRRSTNAMKIAVEAQESGATRFACNSRAKRPAKAAKGIVTIICKSIGVSHKVALHRDLTWCWKCGAWTRVLRLASLAKPCGRPTPRGAIVVSRLKNGLTPDPRVE